MVLHVDDEVISHGLSKKCLIIPFRKNDIIANSVSRFYSITYIPIKWGGNKRDIEIIASIIASRCNFGIADLNNITCKMVIEDGEYMMVIEVVPLHLQVSDPFFDKGIIEASRNFWLYGNQEENYDIFQLDIEPNESAVITTTINKLT